MVIIFLLLAGLTDPGIFERRYDIISKMIEDKKSVLI
jgi:hypothetical protein